MITGNGNDLVMPVTPMGAYGNGGGLGGDWGSWIILFLIFGMFGFGNNGWGGNGGGNNSPNPWLLAANQRTDDSVQAGFNQAAITGQLNGIQSAITDLGTIGYQNQITDLERSFSSQVANTQAISGISSQLAQCCCDNRLATSQTQNIIQSEASATRFANANNTRDIIESNTRGIQVILDKLCALELDGYKRENDNLRSQLNMATLRESQTAQNAFISQGFANEVDQLYNRLSNCPVPTTPVYGRTPIFTCSNSGCGCGMA